MKPVLKRILFVDDEPKIRVTLSAILRRYGFTVSLAGTVSEALQQSGTEDFDILLCDLNIEREGDGYVVVRAIRERNPRCVVIVLTGHGALETAVEGIHAGIDDYILKPTNPDHLVAVLAEKLATRQPRARILSVSYDLALLKTRHMLLESRGYDVMSAGNLDGAIEHCREEAFDLLVLGHSIPDDDKRRMVSAFRDSCPGPVIALHRTIHEGPTVGADFDIEPDPEPLLKCLDDIARRKRGTAAPQPTA